MYKMGIIKREQFSSETNTSLKKVLLKMKTVGLRQSAGRNNSGKITVFHKGGGHKRRYRHVDFSRNSRDSAGIVCSIEYDPNRSALVAAVYDFISNFFYYILAPQNLGVGDIVESGSNVYPKLGNSLPLERVPIGTYVHNLTLTKRGQAKITRSAGTFSTIKEKNTNEVVVELSSGELRVVPANCFGTVGVVSNGAVNLGRLYKAGQSRWLNVRPTVRGVAMNPVDHPHGGGEGKKSGLNKTPWGKHNQRGTTSRSTNKNVIKARNG